MPTTLPQPETLTEDPRAALSGLAWRRATGNMLEAGAPDAALLKWLYEVSKRDAPADLPRYPQVARPLKSPSVMGRFRPVARPERARVPALAKLRISEGQRQRAKVARLDVEPAADQIGTFDRFQLFRQWDGHILEVGGRAFRGVVLIRDTHGHEHRREATFPVRLVRKADRDLLEPGASFYYCIGRFLDKGRPVPASIVWFRRTTPSERSVDEALQSGAEWSGRIAWTT
jgi:hypothetical protein